MILYSIFVLPFILLARAIGFVAWTLPIGIIRLTLKVQVAAVKWLLRRK